jgi:PhnB protein
MGDTDMAGKVKAVPEGTHSLSVHLVVNNATKAIEFYQKAFGAQLLHLHQTPDGKVMHASLKVGDSQFMLADEFPGMGFSSPLSLGGSPVVLNYYVEDVDALFEKAVTAGATVKDAFGESILG